MRNLPTLLGLVLAVPLVSTALPIEEAQACGGCFVQQSENTQVSGHRMVLSISSTQTTLWDQITYDGDPSEFAWVLPIKGQVEIGTSSDLLFGVLESATAVEIYSPQINCPTGNCNSAGGDFGSEGASGTGGGGGGGVTVIAQEVVGPYETVQLQSTDPNALNLWLANNGYSIPADIQPVISAYVGEGFNFLALRLVPGQGIDSMRPVRITSTGASAQLPLRMVAAGTGAVTPISLWVIGEGRYEPQNFPSFQISENQLVWDWDNATSNYRSLREAGFASTNGAGWLLDAAEPVGSWVFSQLVDSATFEPQNSGYADDAGENAVANAEDDVAHLLAGIDESSLWVSHMYAELERPALGADLNLTASRDQTSINRYMFIDNAIGTPPACPPPPDCGGFEDGDGNWFPGGPDNGESVLGGNGGCATTVRSGGTPIALFGLLGAAAVLSRRRRSQR
jgi:MYXO-CTERM domain-containing protein